MNRESLKSLIKFEILNDAQINNMWVFLKCRIKWKDDNDEEITLIRVVPKDCNTEELPQDEDVTYYINNIHDLVKLCDEDNGSDFVVTDYFYSFM